MAYPDPTFTTDQVSQALQFFASLAKQVRSAGGTDADICSMLDLEGQELLEHLAQIIVERRLGHFPISPDVLGKQLAELITQGRYDQVMDGLLTSLGEPGEGAGAGTNPAHVVSYLGGLTTDPVVQRMQQNGLRPATARELLLFGAQYQELPTRAHKGLAALGDRFRDDEGTWYLSITVNTFGRCLIGTDRTWEDPWLFLAFRIN